MLLADSLRSSMQALNLLSFQLGRDLATPYWRALCRVQSAVGRSGRGVFAIKASGHSMNKANINGESVEDGDYVLVDPTCTVIKNGDYVLSIIDGMANIKRYFRDMEHQRIILLSESSASISPIFIHRDDMDNYLVNGKVIQVIKKPKTAWSKFKKFVYRDTPNYQQLNGSHM